MVEERIEDGRRIAELLASELEGLEIGPLAAIAVVDANTDASPGDVAYRIAFNGRRIGRVLLHQDTAVISLDEAWSDDRSTDQEGLHMEGQSDLVIEHGGAVKRATDALRKTVS